MPADFGCELFVRQVSKNACPHESSEGAEPVGAGNVVFDAIANTENVARILNSCQFRSRPIDLGERLADPCYDAAQFLKNLGDAPGAGRVARRRQHKLVWVGAQARRAAPSRRRERGAVIVERYLIRLAACDNNEIGLLAMSGRDDAERRREFVISAGRNDEAASSGRKQRWKAPPLQQGPRHIARGDEEIVKLWLKAQNRHALRIGGAGAAGIGEDDDFDAVRLQRRQSVPRARIGVSPIVQHAVLVEEYCLEGRRDRDEARHSAQPKLRRLCNASRATPAHASCDSADLKGAANLRSRIFVQPEFAAPPPTVRTERSGGAPSSASLR